MAILCEECSKLGPLSCSACRQSNYCSKKCQQKGWRSHKYLCRSFSNFRNKHRPSPTYKRAILFHPDADGPSFFWLKTGPRKERRCGGGDYRQILKLLVNPSEDVKEAGFFPSWSYMQWNRELSRDGCCDINFYYRSSFACDGSKLNKAIDRVVDHSSDFLHLWKGPFIAYGIKSKHLGSAVGKAGIVDLGPRNLRHLRDFFDNYRFPQASRQVFRQMRKELRGTVKAVRINCDGKVADRKKPRFETVRIPRDCSIFRQRPVPISVGLGVPIVTSKIPGSHDIWDERNGELAENQAATFLHIGCNPDVKNGYPSYSFGNPPQSWWGPPGDVIVARADQKPLLPEHVEVLSHYCQFYLLKLFQSYLQWTEDGLGNIQEVKKQTVVNAVTRRRYETYYVKWMAYEDEDKQRRVSWYDI